MASRNTLDVDSWYGDMHPETAGRRDGSSSPPQPRLEEPHAEYERAILERYETHAQTLKQSHAEEEGQLARRFQELFGQFQSAKAAHKAKLEELGGRGLDRPLSHRLALVATTVLGVMMAIVDAFMMSRAQLGVPVSVVLGVVVASFGAASGYISGMVFRQAKTIPTRVVAIALLTAGIGASAAFALTLEREELGIAFRVAMVSLDVVAMLCVCALAFYSHDPDASYPGIVIRHESFKANIMSVIVARDGLRARYCAVVGASRDRAEELIRTYRYHNRQSRGESKVPGFFDHKPDLPPVGVADFKLHGANEVKE